MFRTGFLVFCLVVRELAQDITSGRAPKFEKFFPHISSDKNSKEWAGVMGLIMMNTQIVPDPGWLAAFLPEVQMRMKRHIEANSPESEKAIGFARLIRNRIMSLNYISFVSCWSHSQSESAALWKVYVPSNEGVAIRTTFGNLKRSVIDKSKRILVGLVEYKRELSVEIINGQAYWTDLDILSGGLINYLLFDKRKAYSFESELRLLLIDQGLLLTEEDARRTRESVPASLLPDEDIFESREVTSPLFPKEGNLGKLGDDYPPGQSVKVDLSMLLKDVYVNPGAPRWFLETVQNLGQTVGFDVFPSELDRSPSY